MNTENLLTLKIHKLTQAQYDRELANGSIDENALYLTPEEIPVPIAEGGTGASTATSALDNLGAVGRDVSGRNFTIDGSTVFAYPGAEIFNDYSGNIASGSCSHAEGCYTTASGGSSHAEGYSTTASGQMSYAEGNNTTASGYYSHAEGRYTTASGVSSHAEGYFTTASDYQHSSGKYNDEKSAPSSGDTQDTTHSDAIFMVGCGTSSAKKNAFRITSGGKCYGAMAFGASGADFAELFEWADGNPNDEDRRGLFVALEGEKIKLANAGDDYIGIISGDQAFIGNSASEEWQGKYLTDVFGAKLSQEVEVPAKTDDVTGEVIIPASTTIQYVLNPDYDPNEEYIMRENRKEWGIVGLIGQIIMIDDGTCTVGGYVEPSTNGIGTASNNGQRVMKRIDENHIKVLVK